MAELGAMGFNFDATRLAEVAERGDPSELFDELRSQLRMTGRDLTNLTRSQQLALSNNFGMNISEFQRMAGITPDVGEPETDSDLFTRMVNLLEGVSDIMRGISRTLGIAHAVLLGTIAYNTGVTAKTSIAGSLGRMGKVAGPAAGLAIGTAGGATIGTEMGASPVASTIGAGVGSIAGGFAGRAIGGAIGQTLIPIPGVGFAIGPVLGGLAGGALTGAVLGDDMVSKSGYGDRMLVTPTATVALNNEDNVVAYADDMVSRSTGIELLSKGVIAESAREPAQEVNDKVDVQSLEKKLDQVISAMSSMQVVMDGNKVGRVMSDNEQKASTMGVFQTQRLTG
jgi:hypothetical protein